MRSGRALPGRAAQPPAHWVRGPRRPLTPSAVPTPLPGPPVGQRHGAGKSQEHSRTAPASATLQPPARRAGRGLPVHHVSLTDRPLGPGCSGTGGRGPVLRELRWAPRLVACTTDACTLLAAIGCLGPAPAMGGLQLACGPTATKPPPRPRRRVPADPGALVRTLTRQGQRLSDRGDTSCVSRPCGAPPLSAGRGHPGCGSGGEGGLLLGRPVSGDVVPVPPVTREDFF